MNTNLSPLRPAMTAIAAFIALSSTPLLAQTTDTTAPVVVAPPPPAVAPSAPEAATPAPAEAAPAPAMKTVGTPVVHDADTAPQPSESAAAPMRAAPAKRISTPPAARAPVAPAPVAKVSFPPAKVMPAKVATAPAPVPAPVAKATPTAAQVAANTPPAAPAATATQTTTSTTNDETLPIAGGIGLAIIALGGAAYAVSRRRRGREEGELVLGRPPVETVAVPDAVTPTIAASITHATPKALPNGFDISRFGRHTQAAYLGPTADNPSHSLKRRLKRASFFDQREREAAAAGHPIEQTPLAAPVAQAARVKQDDGQITIRMAPQHKRGGLGYLFQR